MPLLPGEVQLTNLYADCHYFFSPPNTKPAHHRFDKRSYVYLYHDALNRRGRIEIANHAGTPEQDAFNGYLDTADVEYSFKHSTLFTITVQGRILSGSSPASSPQQDISQWHLPAFDQRNENKYMYKLHTVELYLWTTQDADLLLDSFKRVLAPGQLRILDANSTHAEHRDSMSPVVQQLEKAAITSPSHPNQTQRSGSISTTHTTGSGAPAGANQTPVSPPSSPPVEQQQQQSFAPMAYNPAAPAQPEPIAHREKTPPPPDAESGTGLAAAAVHEQGIAGMQPQQYMNPMQQQFAPQISNAPYGGIPGQGIQRTNTIGQPIGQSPVPPSNLPGPPQQSFAPSFAGPPTVAANSPHVDPNAQFMQQHQAPPTPGLSRQSTLPPFTQHPQQAQHPQHPQHPSYPAGFAPSPLQTTPSFGPGAMPTGGLPSPGLPSPGLYSSHPQHGAPSPYAPGPAHGQQMTNHGYGPAGHGVQHGMHGQIYLPEGPNAKPGQAGPGQQAATGGLEQRMGRFEKGVSKFLKRLDK